MWRITKLITSVGINVVFALSGFFVATSLTDSETGVSAFILQVSVVFSVIASYFVITTALVSVSVYSNSPRALISTFVLPLHVYFCILESTFFWRAARAGIHPFPRNNNHIWSYVRKVGGIWRHDQGNNYGFRSMYSKNSFEILYLIWAVSFICTFPLPSPRRIKGGNKPRITTFNQGVYEDRMWIILLISVSLVISFILFLYISRPHTSIKDGDESHVIHVSFASTLVGFKYTFRGDLLVTQGFNRFVFGFGQEGCINIKSFPIFDGISAGVMLFECRETETVGLPSNENDTTIDIFTLRKLQNTSSSFTWKEWLLRIIKQTRQKKWT